MHFFQPETFDQWRDIARDLIRSEVSPSHVHWSDSGDQPGLFDLSHSDTSKAKKPRETANRTAFTVPKAFLEMARLVACHRDAQRWELLYRVLYRLRTERQQLLHDDADDDVHRLMLLRKAVTRDMHKMKAFVRFRKVEADGGAVYVAWHRPDHRIVRLVAPFFARRFNDMHWAIFTPDESVRWNGAELGFGDGVPASEAPESDELESLWLTYYGAIFNPARIKLSAMVSEMPVRHWPTLPETRIIPQLLQQAPARVEEMVKRTEGSRQTAAEFVPQSRSLRSLADAASVCTACPLHEDATQTVFGQGRASARIVLIGEQPGDSEDLAGEPFVGPAGQLLDTVLQQAGIDRAETYVTNVVKHFKFTQKGKRRLHQKPNSREIFACRPWMEAELDAVRPQSLVCLGATAAQALIGREFRITKSRGEILATQWCDQTIATWHPAAILRMPDPARRQEMIEQMVDDLQAAAAVD